MFKNIADFNNINDYLPLFNAVLITDLFVIFLLNTRVIKSQVLRQWYSQYNLSAVIADVLIILIGLIITRAIYYYVFDSFSIVKFVILAVIVQIIHDVLLYQFVISPYPTGNNQVIDVYKRYADENGAKIIIVDSSMMLFSALIAMYLKDKPVHVTSTLLIGSLYIIPYFLYQKTKYP